MARVKLNFNQIASGLLVPILLIVAAAIGYFLILPKFKDVQNVRADLAVKKGHVAAEQASLDGVKNLVADLAKKHDLLAPVDEALPASPDIPELLANLESLAKQSGLTVSNIDIQLPQAVGNAFSAGKAGAEIKTLGDNVGTMTVDLAVAGQYPQLKALILNIEKNLRLLDVQAVTFTEANSDSRSQNYVLQLKTYYQKS